jgi:mannose-6-phosphate isomerase
VAAIKLGVKHVEKPWGRFDIPPMFSDGSGRRIGEAWIVGPDGVQPPPVLVKYLFTSEKLSIQVHPDDASARARGLPGGKSECWYVLQAEPGATLGMGTQRPLDAKTLEREARDGSLEASMDWKPVKAGAGICLPPSPAVAMIAPLAKTEGSGFVSSLAAKAGRCLAKCSAISRRYASGR